MSNNKQGRMAEPQSVLPAKLIIGIMHADEHTLALTIYALVQQFGPIEINGPTISFGFTTYYEEEMGVNLKKIYLAFVKKINPESLSSIKQFTNQLEQKYAPAGKRKINVDPGYVTEHHVVLASTKPSPYRVYLSHGIYGQIVLIYTKQGWKNVEKTFEDYKQKEVQEFLNSARP